MKKKIRLYSMDYKLLTASSLLNRVNNLSEEFIKSNVNLDMIKIVKFVKLNNKIATGFLNTQTLKMI